ncbi:MAG: hypothetical protein HFE43_06475 [Oscillospiraceae bacterium]|nr:hypothetical protein [Oscillospiraceae bacterium]
MKALRDSLPSLRGALLCLAACYVVIGAVLLIFPGMSLVDICYGIGIAAMILGLVSVAFYFIRKGYLSESLGFSGGVALTILGLYAVLQTERFSAAFTQVLAACMIADGIVKLQFSMDLLRLKGKLWWCVLAGALVGVGLAVAILLYDFPDADSKNVYTYVVLIADGVLNALSVALLAWERRQHKREELAGEKPLER